MKRSVVWASVSMVLAMGNGLNLLSRSREIGFDVVAAVCLTFLAAKEWRSVLRQRRQSRP